MTKKRKKFLRLCEELTDYAKSNICLEPYGKNPRSLSVIESEVKSNTKLGHKILNEIYIKKHER